MLLLDTLSLSLAPDDPKENHAALFRPGDRKIMTFPEGGDLNPEHVFATTLPQIIQRLDLLGYSFESIKSEYESSTDYWSENWGCTPIEKISFERLVSLIESNSLNKLFSIHLPETSSDSITSEDTEISAQVFRRIMSVVEKEYPEQIKDGFLAGSNPSAFGLLRRHLCPYSILKLLSKSDSNQSLELIWRLEKNLKRANGDYTNLRPGIKKSDVVLIATEGTTDAFILKNAFEILRPDVADFFQFFEIGIGSSHPASGTDGLVKLGKALCQINLGSRVLFLFDNDAEGVDANQKLLCETLPNEIDSMTLPNLAEFESFPTVGPEGRKSSNINGRAAAIECYLDLSLEGRPPAFVTWRHYKDRLGIYHGVLEHKETYVKKFKDSLKDSKPLGDYDSSKLLTLVNEIVERCIEMAGKCGKH
ncbi:MAG: hypothetical protein EOO52_13630 [Gammaproteobacteria bacterium]|nr:MAG: hypothetical protein EOO52_13630 [Gammaproteobacteria bacterium]